jgi:ABC-type phosphate transport system substrate-binding protein
MLTKKITFLTLIFCGIFLTSIESAPASIEIVVIVNIDNPVTKMGPEIVKNYWLRRFVKRWKDTNKGILPLDCKNKTAEQELFYNEVLGLPTDAVQKYLSARQYQTGDNPPQKFASDAAIMEYVSQEAGALGYINAASLVGKENTVKVVLTIAK